MDNFWFGIVAMCFMSFALGVAITQLFHLPILQEYAQLESETKGCNALRLQVAHMNFKNHTTGVVGLAWPDSFCVYTKNRGILDVLETCTHEYAHTNLDMGHQEEVRQLKEELKEKVNG